MAGEVTDWPVRALPVLGTAALTVTTKVLGGLPITDMSSRECDAPRSGGRGADWHASLEDRQRSLHTHRTPQPALGIDGGRDVNADGGLQ